MLQIVDNREKFTNLAIFPSKGTRTYLTYLRVLMPQGESGGIPSSLAEVDFER